MKAEYLLIDGEVCCVDVNVIYVIKSSDFVKVGVTNDVDRRFQQINSYRFDCELLYSSDYLVNGYEVESKIHEQLSTMRAQRKEWYHAEYLNEILEIVKGTIKRAGVFEEEFTKATEEQISEYKEGEIEDIKHNFDEFEKELNRKILERIAFISSSLLDNLFCYDGNVHCYNRKIYVDPQLLHNCVDDLGDVDEWDDEMIHKYGYTLLEDYLDWNVTDGLYFSTGMVKELCMLINNEKSIDLRKNIDAYEATIREMFPSYVQLCDDYQEIV